MFRAKLDQSGIYLGLEQVTEILEGDIEVDDDCGLIAGRYKWNGVTFLPLIKSQQKPSPEIPSFEEALLSLIAVMPSPPAECVKWAEWYKTSIGGAR